MLGSHHSHCLFTSFVLAVVIVDNLKHLDGLDLRPDVGAARLLGRPPTGRCDNEPPSARELDPAVICDYLRELSGAYQRYYEYGNHDAARRVLHDDEAVRRAKLAASGAVQQTLKNGFALLGVSAPEQM